jgi:import inner membrane translocase subunit TIM21
MPPRVGLRLTALVGAPAQSRPLFAITPAASVFVARCASTSTSTSRATLPAANLAVASSRRFLATHTDGPWNNQTGSQNPGGKKRESVEETLRRLESEARRVGEDREHVGPFPLGVGPSGRRKPWKSWSDLGVRGKGTLGVA